jgi:hypothetical protein
VSGLSGWPAFRGVSMEVWSQWKPGLLSVFLASTYSRPSSHGLTPYCTGRREAPPPPAAPSCENLCAVLIT